MEKRVKIDDSEFAKIKNLTDDGWKVVNVERVNDSQTEYTLDKPDTSKKIKG